MRRYSRSERGKQAVSGVDERRYAKRSPPCISPGRHAAMAAVRPKSARTVEDVTGPRRSRPIMPPPVRIPVEPASANTGPVAILNRMVSFPSALSDCQPTIADFVYLVRIFLHECDIHQHTLAPGPSTPYLETHRPPHGTKLRALLTASRGPAPERAEPGGPPTTGPATWTTDSSWQGRGNTTATRC